MDEREGVRRGLEGGGGREKSEREIPLVHATAWPSTQKKTFSTKKLKKT
jgi:hypothetical protein